MTDERPTFYITTAIDYVNGKPHLGSADAAHEAVWYQDPVLYSVGFGVAVLATIAILVLLNS